MPKKSKDEFKAAFKVIKKPDRPKGVTSKDKSTLEDAMEKKGVGKDEFTRLAAELYEAEPNYLVDLIAHKFVKHFDDDGDKRPYWVGLVPPEAFEKALAKVVPGDMSERLTQVTLEKSVTGKGGEGVTADLIYERDPKGTASFVAGKWVEAHGKGDLDTSAKWALLFPPGSQRQNPSPENVERNKTLLTAIAEADNEEAASVLGERLSEFVIIDESDVVEGGRGVVQGEVKPFPLDHAAILELAETNPKLFAAQMLPAMKGKNEFTDIVTNPDIQELLAREAPQAWKKLVATTPVLRVLDNVDKSIKLKGLTEQDEIVEELFDAIVAGDDMPLAYFTATFTPNSVILSGGTPKDQSIIDDQKNIMGDGAPDVPATQCHQLLHLTKLLMESSGSMPSKPDIVQDTCTNILLTVPLSTLAGKGLLDKTFSGNVFNDADAPTGQILFTGDSGKDSHTWLVIDGVPFDPVLGTRGAEVANSIAERFDWLIVDRVGRGSKGNYIIKGPGKDGKAIPKAAANKMGFGSGYRLTTTPALYLEDDELTEAKILVPVG